MPALVAHERMDVDLVERHLFHKVQPHHHHAGDPKEDDVEAGDERAGRIEAFELRRLVRPPEGRERPQCGRKPSVEDILVAPDVVAGEACALFGIGSYRAALLCRKFADLDIVGERVSNRIVLRLGNEDFAIRTIPGRYLVAPPDLSRDAPWLDVFHPIEKGRLPLRRHKHRLARAHYCHGRLRQRFGVDVPLIGQERFEDGAGAIAMRHNVCRRLDLFDEMSRLKLLDNNLPRSLAALSINRFQQNDFCMRILQKRFIVLQRQVGSLSNTLTRDKPCRRPTSKSLKSCAGVIFTAPEPFSGSAYSSPITGMRRPTSGRIAVLPIRCLRRSLCGWTATATSPSMVSGRVVATMMNSSLFSIGYLMCQSRPLVSTCCTSRSEIAVLSLGSQLTSRLSL